MMWKNQWRFSLENPIHISVFWWTQWAVSYSKGCKSTIFNQSNRGNLINLHSSHVFITGDLVPGHWHYSKEWTKKPSTAKHRQWLMVLVSILCCKCHYWNLIKDYNWIMTKDTFCLRSFTLHMMKREDVNSALFGANTKSNGEAWSHGLFHKKQTTGICHSAQFASPNSASTMLHNFRTLHGRARLCLLTQT